MAHSSPHAGPESSVGTERRWWSLVGLCLVTALVWVTASDISIALPTIAKDLGGSMDTLQWAVNGYFLAGAGVHGGIAKTPTATAQAKSPWS